MPRGAVHATGERAWVFLQTAEGTLVAREVTTGLEEIIRARDLFQQHGGAPEPEKLLGENLAEIEIRGRQPAHKTVPPAKPHDCEHRNGQAHRHQDQDLNEVASEHRPAAAQ